MSSARDPAKAPTILSFEPDDLDCLSPQHWSLEASRHTPTTLEYGESSVTTRTRPAAQLTGQTTRLAKGPLEEAGVSVEEARVRLAETLGAERQPGRLNTETEDREQMEEEDHQLAAAKAAAATAASAAKTTPGWFADSPQTGASGQQSGAQIPTPLEMEAARLATSQPPAAAAGSDPVPIETLNHNERAQRTAFYQRLEEMAVHYLTETTVAPAPHPSKEGDQDGGVGSSPAPDGRASASLSRHPDPDELTDHEREALVGGEHFSTVFDRTLLHRFEDLCHALKSSGGLFGSAAGGPSYAPGTAPNLYELPNEAARPAPGPVSAHEREDHGRLLPELPDLPRNYCVRFQREPVEALGERPCRLGVQCESFALARAKYHMYGPTGNNQPTGFALREFLLPAQLTVVNNALHRGMSHREAYALVAPQMCLLCTRICTQSLAIAQGACFDHQPDHLSSRASATATESASTHSPLQSHHAALVQTHGNLFDCEGEYNSDTALLQAGPHRQGLIKPVVRYHRSHYVRHRTEVLVGPQQTCKVECWADHESIICSQQQAQAREAARNEDAMR